MKLKEYQNDTLFVLKRFLEEARLAGPKNAYEAITREPEQAGRLGQYASAYAPLTRLPNVPYVCLRLPTGGGKTILGAYAIRVARDAWIEKDYPLVLWLAPTKTIRQQTAEALKNRRHPYRRALDEAFSGRVRVFDISDFTQVRPAGSARLLLHCGRHDSNPADQEHRRTKGLRPPRGNGAALLIRSEHVKWTGDSGRWRDQVLFCQSAAPSPSADDCGRSPQCGHATDTRDANPCKSECHHRIHCYAEAQVEHPVQRHGAGTEAGGNDQAADRACRA